MVVKVDILITLEAHLKTPLNVQSKLSRRNQYSGEEEYNVEVRESGSREQEESHEQRHEETSRLTQDSFHFNNLR